MNKNKTIKLFCNDCEQETCIKNQYGDIQEDDIKHCPFCGSDDIEHDQPPQDH